MYLYWRKKVVAFELKSGKATYFNFYLIEIIFGPYGHKAVVHLIVLSGSACLGSIYISLPCCSLPKACAL